MFRHAKLQVTSIADDSGRCYVCGYKDQDCSLALKCILCVELVISVNLKMDSNLYRPHVQGTCTQKTHPRCESDKGVIQTPKHKENEGTLVI